MLEGVISGDMRYVDLVDVEGVARKSSSFVSHVEILPPSEKDA